ncbi:MAG: hypothetical protein LBD06_11265 [Candidatus Accumulibacter sp.]|nr:hypothetical protein [Accumulibacter sp.]
MTGESPPRRCHVQRTVSEDSFRGQRLEKTDWYAALRAGVRTKNRALGFSVFSDRCPLRPIRKETPGT